MFKDHKGENIGDKYLIWTSLSGFDHDKPDSGVENYIKRIGFMPGGFCALVLQVDFVHQYRGLENEYTLPLDVCGYRGDIVCGYRGDINKLGPMDETCLSWTNYDLLKLVKNLRERDIPLYISVMGWYRNDLYHKEWLSEHREILLHTKNGIGGLNALKRFNNGSLYEDFFINKLCKVLSDYDIEGIHLSDEFCPLPVTLDKGDYSCDMVKQFLAYSGLNLPDEINRNLTSDASEDKSLRGNWIWRNEPENWIYFYRWRWTQFFRKLCSKLHSIGKKVSTLGMYVSDPLQSLYCYGLDIREIAKAGVDFFTPNIVPTGLYMNRIDRPPLFHNCMTIAPLTKVFSGVELLSLLGVRDDGEGWNIIHHAQNQLERDIYTLLTYQMYTEKGLSRCIDGLFITLGERIERNDWEWINACVCTAFSLDAIESLSPAVYWSDAAHYNMLPEYIATRRWSTHKFLYEMQQNGVFCSAVIRRDQLEECKTPIFVPNFDLIPEDEKVSLLKYSGGPLLCVTPDDFNISSLGTNAAICFKDYASKYPMKAFLLGAEKFADTSAYEILLKEEDNTLDMKEDHALLDIPHTIDSDLPFCKTSVGFIKACAALLNVADRTYNPFTCNVPFAVYRTGDRRYRLFIYNRYDLKYDYAIVTANRRVEDAKIISSFRVQIIYVDKVCRNYEDRVLEASLEAAAFERRSFQVKIRPSGVAVVDATLEDP